jgi:DNA-binding NtrC family response regulator
MSSRHARVEVRRDGVVLTDLDSKNGTFLNGERIRSAEIPVGQVVQLGRTLLVLRREPPFQWRATGSSLVGTSFAMEALRRSIARAAAHTLPTLILGPTGTGKEPTAREIHRLSGRRGPFVAVNATAIPTELAESELFGHVAGAFSGALRTQEGLFVAAHGGTLFLDELGDMPLAVQPKLLRVLQEGAVRAIGSAKDRSVDVRVLAATHRDPQQLVADGRLREDLYARLSGQVIDTPALASRPEDIVPLAVHFLERAARPVSPLSPALAWAFVSHPWPLNARELEFAILEADVGAEGCLELNDAVQRRLALGRSLSGAQAEQPPSVAPRPAGAAKPRRKAPKPEELLAALAESAGNVTRAAEQLGVHRWQLYRWLRAAGIEVQAEGGQAP